jgi:caspase-like apoptosis-related cysteine protease
MSYVSLCLVPLAGYASFREREAGTWFIQTLCDVIAEHAHEKHLEALLREVIQFDRFVLA